MITENCKKFEASCYGKDISSVISKLREVSESFDKSRRYVVTVELLPVVTVEECLASAVDSGFLIQDSETRYHWTDGVTLGQKALWVDRVAILTGMKKKWVWAEPLFGEKYLCQELPRAKNDALTEAFVKNILPRSVKNK